MDLLPSYPGIEIDWRPIESHPRPEDCRPHTDLCIQAFYAAEEMGADMSAFHRALFRAVSGERQNVEKIEVIAKILKGIVDGEKFLEILKSGKYATMVRANNELAYERNDVWYVPAFRLPASDSKNAPRLDAKGGVGVSREELKGFLDKCLQV